MKYSSEHIELRKVFKFPSEEFKACSIEKIEDYNRIVKGPAYKDFTPRTIAGMKKDNILPALKWLAENLYGYIHSEEVDFDEWHRKTCTEFCNQIKDLHGAIPYGKAQKIVNMSFKYLFCLDDSQKYTSKFTCCHMALDSYTLEWFVRYVLSDNAFKHIRKTKINETSWSKLEYGADEDDEYSYLWIQNLIKKYLASAANKTYIDEKGVYLSPFLAEFYIWPEMQLHMAMESLYAQSESDKAKFKKMSIPEKIIELKRFLAELDIREKNQ